jgi:hypothetical protein
MIMEYHRAKKGGKEGTARRKELPRVHRRESNGDSSLEARWRTYLIPQTAFGMTVVKVEAKCADNLRSFNV